MHFFDFIWFDARFCRFNISPDLYSIHDDQAKIFQGVKAQLKIESKEFDNAIDALVKLTGASQEDVIKSECKAILGKAQEMTGKADKKKINLKYTYKGEGDLAHKSVTKFVKIDGKSVSVRQTLKKGVWGQTPKGKVRFYKNRANPLYKKLLVELNRLRIYAISQIGQSKSTHVYIANLLKLKSQKGKLGGTRIPRFVESLSRNLPSKLKRLLKAHEKTTGVVYGVTMMNLGRVVNSHIVDGRMAFYRAFHGREKFYKTNIAKGVFKSSKKALAKYPSLKVTMN